MKALVILEPRFLERSLTLIQYAKEKWDCVHVVSFAKSHSDMDLDSVGVDWTQVTQEKLGHYHPEYLEAGLLLVIESYKPHVILALDHTLNRDFLPRIAASLKSTIINEVTEVKIKEGDLLVKKPMYTGKLIAWLKIRKHPSILLMNTSALPLVEKNLQGGEKKEQTFSLEKTLIKDIQYKKKEGSKLKSLSEASRIISGGRGLQEAKNFQLLEQVAEIIDAAVGASRAVVDAGWVPHHMQVGQTGMSVSPSLYIACGISGAIQHLVGITGAKIVVSINKDPDSLIFKHSNYGLVGDIFEIIPVFIKEYKKQS